MTIEQYLSIRNKKLQNSTMLKKDWDRKCSSVLLFSSSSSPPIAGVLHFVDEMLRRRKTLFNTCDTFVPYFMTTNTSIITLTSLPVAGKVFHMAIKVQSPDNYIV